MPVSKAPVSSDVPVQVSDFYDFVEGQTPFAKGFLCGALLATIANIIIFLFTKQLVHQKMKYDQDRIKYLESQLDRRHNFIFDKLTSVGIEEKSQ